MQTTSLMHITFYSVAALISLILAAKAEDDLFRAHSWLLFFVF